MNTQDIDALGQQVAELANGLMTVLESQDIAIGLAAILAVVREVTDQAEDPSTRALVVRDLREMADLLEAADSTKH